MPQSSTNQPNFALLLALAWLLAVLQLAAQHWATTAHTLLDTDDAMRLLQDARTLAVSAGNPTLSNADKASVAAELESRYQELLGIANRTDGNGQFLFSGYQGATQPFAETRSTLPR